jgi:hypothetical protein
MNRERLGHHSTLGSRRLARRELRTSSSLTILSNSREANGDDRKKKLGSKWRLQAKT